MSKRKRRRPPARHVGELTKREQRALAGAIVGVARPRSRPKPQKRRSLDEHAMKCRRMHERREIVFRFGVVGFIEAAGKRDKLVTELAERAA